VDFEALRTLWTRVRESFRSPNFDADRLWPQLRQLTAPGRALFAAACASRLANCAAEHVDPGDHALLEETRGLMQQWWGAFNEGTEDGPELEALALRIAEEAEERFSAIVSDAAAAAHYAYACFLHLGRVEDAGGGCL
jgi:hypothetical protein